MRYRESTDRVQGVWARSLALVMVLLGLGAAPAMAQFQDRAPAWVVVTEEAAAVRCDDFDRFYAIRTCEPGDLLLSDAASPAWVRVRYTGGAHALVPGEDATIAGDGRVELARPSRLRAPSEKLGASGSWRSLFTRELAVGTTLELIPGEAIERNDDGSVAAYRVVPPEPPVAPEFAWGYIRADSVRDATPAEIQAYEQTLRDNAIAAEEEVQSEPEQTPSVADAGETQGDDEATDAATDQTETEPVESITSAPSIDDSLLQPMNTAPVEAPETPEGSEIASADQTPADAAAQTPVPGVPSESLTRLDEMFRTVRALPRDELDASLEEMLAEFSRAVDILDPADEAWREPLEARMTWTRLRMESRDQRRAIERALGRATEADTEMARRVEAWHAVEGFELTGRLERSAVYNGDRLPLMYRVVSLEPSTSGLTLGYVRPKDADEYRMMLGAIVGVSGQSERDGRLARAIVRPSRIVELDGSAFAVEPTDGP